MGYKTILVHVDESRRAEARVDIAARIAMEENAHLIGIAATGVSRFLYDTVVLNPQDPNIIEYLETLRTRAESTLRAFEERARQLGVRSLEKRLIDDEPSEGISLQARCSDLVILGQHDPAESSSSTDPNLPEHVAINGGCPVLLVPRAQTLQTIGQRVLLAWNASIEAKRTVHAAIPLLKKARIVEVALFRPTSEPVQIGQRMGDDIAIYLARHNIKAGVIQNRLDRDVGASLLALGRDLGSDLLVMGCYGHSRFREMLLGGATRTVLASAATALLIGH